MKRQWLFGMAMALAAALGCSDKSATAPAPPATSRQHADSADGSADTSVADGSAAVIAESGRDQSATPGAVAQSSPYGRRTSAWPAPSDPPPASQPSAAAERHTVSSDPITNRVTDDEPSTTDDGNPLREESAYTEPPEVANPLRATQEPQNSFAPPPAIDDPAADESPVRRPQAFSMRSFGAAAPPSSAAAPPAIAPPSSEPFPGAEQPLLQPPSGGAGPGAYSPEAYQSADAMPAAPPPPLPAHPPEMAAENAPPPEAVAIQQMVAMPPKANDPFDVVQVFYGTDRSAWAPPLDRWPDVARRSAPAIAALLAAVLLGLGAVMWRHWFVASLALCSFATTAVLGYQVVHTTLERARIAEKEGLRYTAARSATGEVQLGICEVTIPETHQVGELEAPSVMRLEFHEDTARHVVLRKTERLHDAAFYEQLQARVAQSPRKELFVFIHGFNVSFEDAARRTAQMSKDLEFGGAPVFFSWPANQWYLLTYNEDSANVSWAAPHLKRFLLDIVQNSDAQSINLVAHSMGNRALTSVLRELQWELKSEARLFNQVVLAAPDIDAEEFRNNIAPYIGHTSNRITLYASSHDTALAASQLVHGYPRAGDSGASLVLVPGIDTIDVSAIDGGPWGHSYYGSSDPILQDLAEMFYAAATPQQRRWLLAQDRSGLPYWVFQATTRTSANANDDPVR